MEISGLVSALLIGAAVGLLGRLVLPGRQHIGVLWTLVVGIGAALLGSLLASLLGVGSTRGVDWIECGFGMIDVRVGGGCARPAPGGGAPL
ncbi:hypothetical protein ACFV00_25925, partial [Streptomyces californicus]|uniref:hypothetical protein n=1 Tax=Streptomyces californicus TaxID=67351 RepID=UPI0036BD233C